MCFFVYKKIIKKIEFIKFVGDFKTLKKRGFKYNGYKMKIYSILDNLNIYVAGRVVKFSKYHKDLNLLKFLINNNFYLGENINESLKKQLKGNSSPEKLAHLVSESLEQDKTDSFKVLYNTKTEEYELYNKNKVVGKNIEEHNKIMKKYIITIISSDFLELLKEMYNNKEIIIDSKKIEDYIKIE